MSVSFFFLFLFVHGTFLVVVCCSSGLFSAFVRMYVQQFVPVCALLCVSAYVRRDGRCLVMTTWNNSVERGCRDNRLLKVWSFTGV